MQINNVTITEKELCRAVELYLATQGISLPVESADALIRALHMTPIEAADSIKQTCDEMSKATYRGS